MGLWKGDIQSKPHHLCLFDRAGETIQQEAILAGWRVQVLLDEFHHHLVTDLHKQNKDNL